MSLGIQAFSAASPILAILVLMLGLRWSAARAGAVGLLIAIVAAWTIFGFGERILPQTGRLLSVAGALSEAIFIALTILWIVFPALCIYELQRNTGALEVLRRAIAAISPDPRITAFLVGWFFALFMEGAAGFGTSAALAAPFLVGMGIGKLEAVAIALVGHAIGVSFGAVGTPVVPQLAIADIPPRELAAATARYHALLGWFMAFAVLVLVNRALPRQMSCVGTARQAAANASIWGWALFAALCFLLPFYLLAAFVGPELPTLGGSLIGAAFFSLVLWLRNRSAGRDQAVVSENSLSAAEIIKAASPYFVLIFLVLATRLIPALADNLRTIRIAWQLGPFDGDMLPLYHPGTLLMLSFIAAAAWQRARPTVVLGAMKTAMRRLILVALALGAMLGLARIMVHAGMIELLAHAAADSLGRFYPLFAPFVGALGTFVTGSATASNILFSELQRSTATQLGFSVPAILGAQSFGAAVGNVVCPHNIIAATAVVELSGKEGPVLRRTAGVMVIYTALGGLLALAFFA